MKARLYIACHFVGEIEIELPKDPSTGRPMALGPADLCAVAVVNEHDKTEPPLFLTGRLESLR